MGGAACTAGCPITIDEWFGLVGKGDLQDFQDCFAAETGISLALIGRAGDELLVPSKDRWFCKFTQTHYSHVCQMDDSAVLGDLIKRYERRRDIEPTIRSCDFGLSSFIVPVYCDDHLLAFWRGGGFALDDQYRAEALNRKFDVVLVNREDLRRDLRRLVAMTRLLNISITGSRMRPTVSRSESVFVGKLTRREREVAELVCHGMSNKEVAQTLFLSEKTVKSHMSNILSKLGVRDRTQLVFEFSGRHDSEVPR